MHAVLIAMLVPELMAMEQEGTKAANATSYRRTPISRVGICMDRSSEILEAFRNIGRFQIADQVTTAVRLS